ncbi:hypothetical protein D3C83_323180 [compost metagenome]
MKSSRQPARASIFTTSGSVTQLNVMAAPHQMRSGVMASHSRARYFRLPPMLLSMKHSVGTM